jgi:hypothetical protein
MEAVGIKTEIGHGKSLLCKIFLHCKKRVGLCQSFSAGVSISITSSTVRT